MFDNILYISSTNPNIIDIIGISGPLHRPERKMRQTFYKK